MFVRVENHLFNMDQILHVYLAMLKHDRYDVIGEFVNPAHPEGVDEITIASFKTREESESFLRSLASGIGCLSYEDNCGLIDYTKCECSDDVHQIE